MTDYETMRIERDDRVAVIELCRPDLMNRFDDALHVEFTAALHELAADREVLAVVLASTGKYFSAGGDFEMMLAGAADYDARVKTIDDGRRLFRACGDFPKPLVVALHGDAIGLGATIVLTGDAVVAARSAKLSDPHVRIGLVAGDGGCIVWPSAVGIVKAKRHLLWGDALTAEEAHSLGMISDLVDTVEEVRPTALRLAHEVAALPPVAVQLTKRTLNKAMHARIDEVLDVGFYLEAISMGSSDLVEAVTAFRERRPGEWTGR